MFKLVKEDEKPRVLDTVFKVVIILGVLAAFAAAAYVFVKKVCPSWCGRGMEDDDLFCDGNCLDCDLDCEGFDDDYDDEPALAIETEQAAVEEFEE